MPIGNMRMKDGQRRNLYPDERKSTKGRTIFPWRRLAPEALCVIYLIAHDRATDEDLCMRASYKGNGITARFIYEALQKYCPHVFPLYEAMCGRRMPIDLAIKRLYPMYHKHIGKGLGMKRCYNKEHPLMWEPQENGRRLVEDCDQAIKAGKIIRATTNLRHTKRLDTA